jgi:rubrerythrin
MRKLESNQIELFSAILAQLEDEDLREAFGRLRDDEVDHEKSVRSLQDMVRECCQ